MGYICPCCGSNIYFKDKRGYYCPSGHITDSQVNTAKPDVQIDFSTFTKHILITYSTTTDCFFISERFGSAQAVNIKDVVEFSVECENQVIFKQSFNPTAMVAGGLLFGGFGAIAGSKVSGGKVTQNSKKIYEVSISIGNLDYPGLKFKTKDFDKVHKLANAFEQLFKKYGKENQNDKTSNGANVNDVKISDKGIDKNEIPELLKKYHQLVVDGIITQEEFEKIKIKLLNV